MLVLYLTRLPLRASPPAEAPCHCKPPVDRQSKAARGTSGQVGEGLPFRKLKKRGSRQKDAGRLQCSYLCENLCFHLFDLYNHRS